jgi:predicted phosphodiesterase
LSGSSRLLLAVTLLSACHRTSVLPEALEALGSVGSPAYAAQELYPEAGAPVVVLRPRIGTPAVLVEASETFELRVWTASTVAATALGFELRPAGGDPVPVLLEAPLACDADRLCAATARAVADLPPGVPHALCAVGPGGEDCRAAAVHRLAAAPDPLRIAQVTDLHLTGATDDDAADALDRVLAAIAAADPPFHVVVATGDLTASAGVEAFEDVVRRAAASPLPFVAVPGNHDFKLPGIDGYLLTLTPFLDHVTAIGPYRIVALSTGPAEKDAGGGALSFGFSHGLEAGQIAWLEAALAESGAATVVLVHQPPYAFLPMRIGKRRDALMSLLRDAGVPLLLAGHTHAGEAYDGYGFSEGLSTDAGDSPARKRWPVSLVSPRSTAREPGYRAIALRQDGSFDYAWVPVR